MAFAVNRIDHVVLNCRDVDATADWYVRVLGMRREVFGEGRVALVFGNQKINVRPSGAPNWDNRRRRRPGSLDLCFIADRSPDDIGAHLRECGVQLNRWPGPQDRGAGPADVALLCRDPDGNLIEVASYSARD